MTDARVLAVLEALALAYHKRTDGDGEGEYGCPGLSCPGVKKLVKFLQEAEHAVAPLRARPQGEEKK